MSKQLMIYNSATPISAEHHKGWSVKPGTSFAFAKEANSSPITLSEFRAAQSEFPIVFVGDDEIMPVAILGLQDGQNVFVDENNGWRAGYIPAFLRQYPFVFANSEDGQTLTLCLDEEFEGVNQDGRGERLFDTDGERTTYLNNALNFAQAVRREFIATQEFCNRLKELDLLESTQASIEVGGQTRQLQGFQAVSRDKLKALSDEVALELLRNDSLELIYGHLTSLGQFRRLAELRQTTVAQSAEFSSASETDANAETEDSEEVVE